MIIFTATYASAHYALMYSIVSVIFNAINIFHIFTAWTHKDRRETLDYLQMNSLLGFLSFLSVFLTYYLLKNLIKIARDLEQNLQPFERKYQIMVGF